MVSVEGVSTGDAPPHGMKYLYLYVCVCLMSLTSAPQLKLTMELAFVYQVHGRKDAALALYEKGLEHWSKMLGAVWLQIQYM